VFDCPIDVYILRLLQWAADAYRSLNATVAHSKYSFGVNTTTKLKTVITTSDSYGIWRAMF